MASVLSSPLVLAPEPALGVLDDPLEQQRYTHWVAGAQGQRLAESALQLSGMHCAACSGLIEQALLRVPGVQTAQVSAAAERATVRWDPALVQPSALIAAVRAAGYGAVPDAAAPARALRQQAQRQALWRLFVAGFCAMQVMMMATPAYVAGPGEMAPDLKRLLDWGAWLLTLPVMLFSAGPYFGGAWRALRARRIGMDVPVALGIGITFVASTGAAFDPGGVFGHEVYFDSLTMFVSFLLGARYLELHARHRAAAALEQSLAALPATAWLVSADGSGAGSTQAVSVHRLQPGDLLRVPVGDAFAADGVIEQGHTQADEALLSGESAPVAKHPGMPVVAGSINLLAPVLLRVQRVGADTRLETIVAMMRSAMSQRPATAALADRWAAPFLWAVLLLAAGAAAVWSVIDPARAVWVAVSVLIVTCPCALSLAAPATLVAAARGLARRGVLLQRLDALPALAAVQQVFFDKTGTLTEDRPRCSRVQRSAAGRALCGDDSAALRQAAGLARWSSHPLSAALVQAAAELGGDDAAGRWTDVHEQPGQGLQARDARGRLWKLGSAAWTGAVPAANGAAANTTAANTAAANTGAATAASDASDPALQVWLACDGRLLAGFGFEESLRPGTEAALQALAMDGLRLSLLTGDAPARAQALGLRLGFDDVIAGATPEAKLDAVIAAQRAGRSVLMVGDGINDAPVLARADVSLAMGQGALVARGQADAVLTRNRIADIVAARHTARRALRIVRQNFFWAGAYNATSIPLALLGWLPPWAAGLGMAASSLVVVLNALRAAR